MTDGGANTHGDGVPVTQDAPPGGSGASVEPPRAVPVRPSPWLRVKLFLTASAPVVVGALFVSYAWVVSRDLPARAVAVLGGLALLVIAIVGRRPRVGPRTLAIAPALVLWTGVAGLTVQVAASCLTIDEVVAPAQQQRAYYEAVAESLDIGTLASLFAALLLTQAAAVLSYRARSIASPLRWNGTMATALTAGSFLLLLLVRALLELPASWGIFTAIVASIVIGMVWLGARVIRATDAQGETTERVWETTLAAGLCGLGSVAAATTLGLLDARSRVLATIVGESVDPSQRARIFTSTSGEMGRELNLGMIAAALVSVLLLIGLGARMDAARAKALSIAAVAAALFVCPLGALLYQASALTARGLEFRLGEVGELTPDRRFEPGALQVELVPIAAWGEATGQAEVVVTPGSREPWSPESPAVFTGLSRSDELRIDVVGDYLVAPVDSFVMPRDHGARLRVGVLSVLPPPFSTAGAEHDNFEPEKILHIEVSSEAYALRWAAGRVVHAETTIPRRRGTLAGAVSEQWRQWGSHLDPHDRKRDVAIVHFGPGESLIDLVSMGAEVSSTQRDMVEHGAYFAVPRPAMRTLFARTRPSAQDLDDELVPDRLGLEAGDYPDAVLERVAEALTRCEGKPCVNSERNDRFGIELRDRCGAYLCSATTTAKLWSALAIARAASGDGAGAEQAFLRARTLEPALDRPASMPEVAVEAFDRASKVKLPRVRDRGWAVNGGLRPEVVQQTVARRHGLIRACYADGLVHNPSLRGAVSMRMVIGRDGVARSVGSAGSDMPSAEVISCIARHLRGMSFPAPDGGVVTVVAQWFLSPP